MKNKFVLFLNNAIFLFHSNFLESSCNAHNPLIEEERLDTLFSLKSTLEKGLSASELSVYNTRKQGFIFLHSYIKKAVSLADVEWKDKINSNEKLSTEENKIFNLKISLGVKTIDVKTKLNNVANALQYKIENLLKRWQNSSIISKNLDSWDTWNVVFEKLIINHPELTHSQYGFNKKDLMLKPETKDNKLHFGDNIICIVIKLDNLKEDFCIKIRSVTESNGEKVYKKIARLVVTNRAITSEHKPKYLLEFLNKKRQLKAKDYSNILISKIVRINDEKNYLVEGKNNVLVTFKNTSLNKSYDHNISLENVALFTPNDAIKNLVDIFSNLNFAFTLNKNNKWDDLKKLILENSIVNDKYLFTKSFSLELSEDSSINTETITKPQEKRSLKIRFKVDQSESTNVLIYYQVKDKF